MYCLTCGLPVNESDAFCRSCGSENPYHRYTPGYTVPKQQPPPWVEPLPPQQQYPQPIQYQQPAYAPPHCPRCNSTHFLFKRRVSTAGWIVFVVGFLFCLPLGFLGFLLREDYKQCGVCGLKL